jgi:hypothetical protein
MGVELGVGCCPFIGLGVGMGVELGVGCCPFIGLGVVFAGVVGDVGFDGVVPWATCPS